MALGLPNFKQNLTRIESDKSTTHSTNKEKRKRRESNRDYSKYPSYAHLKVKI